VENNGYADFIAQRDHQKIERISDRASAYAMPGIHVDGNDVIAVHLAAVEAVERARSGGGPTLIECVTYRWRGHYEGDPQPYRTQDEVEGWKARDPLPRAEAELRTRDAIDDPAKQAIVDDIRGRIDEAVAFAESSPFPEPEEALNDIYTDIVERGW
jgi:pyruvate dehydrogenase E1 component alpha subunit